MNQLYSPDSQAQAVSSHNASLYYSHNTMLVWESHFLTNNAQIKPQKSILFLVSTFEMRRVVSKCMEIDLVECIPTLEKMITSDNERQMPIMQS